MAKLKKPYLKKIRTHGKFDVWYVDGRYIRDHIDIEFTNFGQHYKFDFIPKNEFWIDKEHGIVEEKFYVDHLLVEHRLMKKGMSYEDALDRANEVERKERNKVEIVKMFSNMKNHEVIDKIHKSLLKSYSNKNLSIWIVNGKYVRDAFYIDFTQGGHDKVYPFVPANEVWLDDDISQRERKLILLHELNERALMSKGMSYIEAHRLSSALEQDCRQKANFDKQLQIVLKKNI